MRDRFMETLGAALLAIIMTSSTAAAVTLVPIALEIDNNKISWAL